MKSFLSLRGKQNASTKMVGRKFGVWQAEADLRLFPAAQENEQQSTADCETTQNWRKFYYAANFDGRAVGATVDDFLSLRYDYPLQSKSRDTKHDKKQPGDEDGPVAASGLQWNFDDARHRRGTSHR